MVALIYVLIIIAANVIGSISGLGGGSIIKPILDLFRFHSVAEISLYSSVAVFLMSISSTMRQMKNKVDIDWNFALLNSFGSFIGGLLGQGIFDLLMVSISNEAYVSLVQITLTIITLIISYYLTQNESINFGFTSSISKIFVGLCLGLLASLLGIGGGPLNVAILMACFGVGIREATVYSIITIFFSQLSKLGMIVISQSYIGMDLKMILFIIPAALFGGILGAKISGKLSNESIKKIFNLVLIIVFFINCYNAIKIFI
ncbi:sulfite exporter TauE/SafE family protein [Erysipelothrix urinaevulpis]|uniref:sulfite exporter TauE/SafE family protein n=1 Tax=Erysipelothrix urinaevulpis TaxID=2683717 RepID=UPI00135A0B31|nr:sulfite exporter TauE/SafE family protein [Erysipelothrix urinaevulpis]